MLNKVFLKKKFINKNSKAYLLSDLSMIDIDEPFHLEIAKSLFQNKKFKQIQNKVSKAQLIEKIVILTSTELRQQIF